MKTQITLETVSLTNRRFGVEMEISGSRLDVNTIIGMMASLGIGCEYQSYNHRVCSVWKITSDASIRRSNTDFSEFELVSPILRGKDGLESVRVVCGILATAGCVVNSSCGLHVHHEVADYKAKNLERIVCFYRRAQDSIDMIMPVSRRGNSNHYCQPVAENTESVTRQYGSRYYKLNIQSYYKYGTVEFRHHSGTVDAEKIIAWVIFTQAIVERCKRSFRLHAPEMTWYDVMQAVGFVHNHDNGAVRNYLTKRYNKFSRRRSLARVAEAM